MIIYIYMKYKAGVWPQISFNAFDPMKFITNGI